MGRLWAVGVICAALMACSSGSSKSAATTITTTAAPIGAPTTSTPDTAAQTTPAGPVAPTSAPAPQTGPTPTLPPPAVAAPVTAPHAAAPPPVPPPTVPTTTAPPAPRTIIIAGRAFASPMHAQPGAVVTWENDDPMTHTITADAGQPYYWDSGGVGPGRTFSLTFTNTRTYSYHCELHPGMTGILIVG